MNEARGRNINNLRGRERFSKISLDKSSFNSDWKITFCSGDETVTTEDFRFGHIPSEAVVDELTGRSFK